MIRSKIISSIIKNNEIYKKKEFKKKFFKKYELENKEIFLINFEGGYKLNEIMAKGELKLLSKKDINLKGLNIDISKNIYILLLNKEYKLKEIKILNKLVIGKIYYYYKDNIYRIQLISKLNLLVFKQLQGDDSKKIKDLRDDLEEQQINVINSKKSIIEAYIINKININIKLIKIFINLMLLLANVKINK